MNNSETYFELDSKEATQVLIVTHVTHVEGSKETLTVLIVTHVTHVKGVKRRNNNFTHNFLNIQGIFNLKKVLESWDWDLFNQCYVCWRGQKLFWLLTPSTCFNIHSIGWYGWKGLSLSFPKLFSDWKSIEY